jgi:hypothetical protein
MMQPSLFHDVLQVEYRHDYVVWVSFDDDSNGEVDFSEWQPFPGVLEPLKQVDCLASVQIHPESKTLYWDLPNPVDVDPIWLYCRANQLPLPVWKD